MLFKNYQVENFTTVINGCVSSTSWFPSPSLAQCVSVSSFSISWKPQLSSMLHNSFHGEALEIVPGFNSIFILLVSLDSHSKRRELFLACMAVGWRSKFMLVQITNAGKFIPHPMESFFKICLTPVVKWASRWKQRNAENFQKNIFSTLNKISQISYQIAKKVIICY